MRGRAPHPLLQGPRPPQRCVWELTRLCNSRCVHCENVSGPRAPEELAPSELDRVADNLIALGCRHVDLTGGEPLLRREWQAVAARLSGGGVEVALVSNGLLLDERALDACQAAGVR